ncbi:MAG: hypothetical protein COA63_009830 [Methylophaga sp.]|nr:hypothetical protein [Methylophaga sp.]
MKTKVTTLSFAVVMCGCAIEPVITAQPDGKQSYTINCSSGIDKCHQRSAKLCPTGYDIIEHSKKTSTLVPHYGEYPMTINIENLTISCK